MGSIERGRERERQGSQKKRKEKGGKERKKKNHRISIHSLKKGTHHDITFILPMETFHTYMNTQLHLTLYYTTPHYKKKKRKKESNGSASQFTSSPFYVRLG